jgi:hypothetical protein
MLRSAKFSLDFSKSLMRSLVLGKSHQHVRIDLTLFHRYFFLFFAAGDALRVDGTQISTPRLPTPVTMGLLLSCAWHSNSPCQE